jgi:hypothetical protein
MENLKNIFALVLLITVIASCDPMEDRDSMPSPISNDELQFSVSQDPENANSIFLSSSTPGSIPFWDYIVGSTNKATDTVFIPFEGEYWIKYYAYSGGIPAVDSAFVSLPQNNEYFSDPAWDLLTNGAAGKKWKLSAVYVGPESNYNAVWWMPDVSGHQNFNDVVSFDLNRGYNFKRTHEGVEQSTSYALNLTSDVLSLNGDLQMPIYDYGEDLKKAGLSINKYRVFELTSDRLVLGQGASFIPARRTEDWAWFSVYVPAE